MDTVLAVLKVCAAIGGFAAFGAFIIIVSIGTIAVTAKVLAAIIDWSEK